MNSTTLIFLRFRTLVRAMLCLAVLAASVSSALGKISCDLLGLKIGERSFKFGTEIEIVADGLDEDNFYSSIDNSEVMRVRELGGIVLDQNDSIHIQVFG